MKWGGLPLLHDGLRNVEPRVEPLGALLHIADGVQVLVELRAVVLAQVEPQRLGVVEHGVEHAAAFGRAGPLGGDAAGRLAEEPVKDVLGIVLGRQRHAVAREGQRRGVERLAGARGDRKFERRKARLLADHLGHELIAGDRVLVLAAALRFDLRAREPGVRADVRLAEAVRMMQAAEDREVGAMLLERLQRRREVVVAPGLRDLPRHAVHAVGDVDEHAAPRLGSQRRPHGR